MGKREPQIILKTDERSIHLELGRGDNLIAKSIGWGENRGFLRATSSRSQSRTGAGVAPHLARSLTGSGTASTLFSGRLKRRFNSRDTVTETALHVVTPLPLADRGGELVGDEEADGFRLLIVVGA